jgi:hypothetical protein
MKPPASQAGFPVLRLCVLSAFLKITRSFPLRISTRSDFPKAFPLWNELAETSLCFYQTIPTWLIDGITIRDSAGRQV